MPVKRILGALHGELAGQIAYPCRDLMSPVLFLVATYERVRALHGPRSLVVILLDLKTIEKHPSVLPRRIFSYRLAYIKKRTARDVLGHAYGVGLSCSWGLPAEAIQNLLAAIGSRQEA